MQDKCKKNEKFFTLKFNKWYFEGVKFIYDSHGQTFLPTLYMQMGSRVYDIVDNKRNLLLVVRSTDLHHNTSLRVSNNPDAASQFFTDNFRWTVKIYAMFLLRWATGS